MSRMSFAPPNHRNEQSSHDDIPTSIFAYLREDEQSDRERLKEWKPGGDEPNHEDASPVDDPVAIVDAAIKLNVLTLLNSVLVACQMLNYPKARSLLDEAMKLAERIGDKVLSARCLYWEGQLFAADERIENACAAFVEARDIIGQGSAFGTHESERLLDYLCKHRDVLRKWARIGTNRSSIDMVGLERQIVRRMKEKVNRTKHMGSVTSPIFSDHSSPWPQPRKLDLAEPAASPRAISKQSQQTQPSLEPQPRPSFEQKTEFRSGSESSSNSGASKKTPDSNHRMPEQVQNSEKDSEGFEASEDHEEFADPYDELLKQVQCPVFDRGIFARNEEQMENVSRRSSGSSLASGSTSSVPSTESDEVDRVLETVRGKQSRAREQKRLDTISEVNLRRAGITKPMPHSGVAEADANSASLTAEAVKMTDTLAPEKLDDRVESTLGRRRSLITTLNTHLPHSTPTSPSDHWSSVVLPSPSDVRGENFPLYARRHSMDVTTSPKTPSSLRKSSLPGIPDFIPRIEVELASDDEYTKD